MLVVRDLVESNWFLNEDEEACIGIIFAKWNIRSHTHTNAHIDISYVQNNDSFWLFFNPNKWDEMMQLKHDEQLLQRKTAKRERGRERSGVEWNFRRLFALHSYHTVIKMHSWEKFPTNEKAWAKERSGGWQGERERKGEREKREHDCNGEHTSNFQHSNHAQRSMTVVSSTKPNSTA